MSDNVNPYSNTISPGTPSSSVDAATLEGASLSTDVNLTANSDVLIPTQKAIKTYADEMKSSLQAADDVIKDIILGGKSVGNADGNIPVNNGTVNVNLNSQKLNGATLSTDGTLATNSDTLVSTEKAVKTYSDTKIPKTDIDTTGTLGTSDTKVPSQKAVKTYADDRVPVGCIMMWPLASAPDGWLLCAGAAVSRSTYADLFSALGIDYGAGDGSTTFNLPDFAGRSPKGVGTSSGGSDVTHVAETIDLATKYNDKMQVHVHNISWTQNFFTAGAVSAVITIPGGSVSSSSGVPQTDATHGTPRTGTTTTGKTLGINFIIKY